MALAPRPRAPSRTSTLRAALALLASATLAAGAGGQTLVKLEAPDAQPYDQHGWAVAVHGGTVAVGSHLADGLGLFNVGAVYVSERDGTVHKLLAPEAAQNDRFGLSTALGPDLLAVGSRHAAPFPESGVVDVFRRTSSGWRAATRLVPPEPQPLAHFGDALALAGDLLVVGAPSDDAPLFNQGAAYVYRRSSGGALALEARLLPADAHAEQYFGVAVATDGARVVVGAHWDSAHETLGGAAYVFAPDGLGGWTQAAKLVPPDLAPYDDFGRTVAISGGRVAVGAPSDDDGGNGSGAVYLFDDADGGWVLEAKLQPLDPQVDHTFGRALALDDGLLAAGAVDPSGPLPYAGALYLFAPQPGGWIQRAKIASPAAPGSASFASALAMSRGTVVCGGHLDDSQGDDAGAAWVLRLR